MCPRRTGPEQEVGIKITAAERKLILDNVAGLDDVYATVFRRAKGSQPVAFLLDEWDAIESKIAYEARNAIEKPLGERLWRIYRKIGRNVDSVPKGTSLLRWKPHRKTSP